MLCAKNLKVVKAALIMIFGVWSFTSAQAVFDLTDATGHLPARLRRRDNPDRENWERHQFHPANGLRHRVHGVSHAFIPGGCAAIRPV